VTWQAEVYSRAYYELVTSNNLSAFARLLLIYLNMVPTHSSEGKIFTSTRYLASEFDKSTTIIRSALKELEEKGWIRKEGRICPKSNRTMSNALIVRKQSPFPQEVTKEVA